MAERALNTDILTPEEYLEREHASTLKHEYVDGVMYAMAGASDRHGLVAGNLFAAIHSRLPEGCEIFMADMKLRVKTGVATVFYYPDILVSCASRDRDSYFREQPILVIEVLSPTTERVDRTEKFDAYRRLSSLEEYVLADQDMPKVEVFRRRTAWQRETFVPDDGVTLESAGLKLTIADIYRRVKF